MSTTASSASPRRASRRDSAPCSRSCAADPSGSRLDLRWSAPTRRASRGAVRRPVLVIEPAEISGDLLRDARLASALEGRVLAVKGLDVIGPTSVRGPSNAFAHEPRRSSVHAGERAGRAWGPDGRRARDAGPGYSGRRSAWAMAAGTEEVDEVAAKFRLSLSQIADAAKVAASRRGARAGSRPRPPSDLGARRASATRLGSSPIDSTRSSGGTTSSARPPLRDPALDQLVPARSRPCAAGLGVWRHEAATRPSRRCRGRSARARRWPPRCSGAARPGDLPPRPASIVSKYIGEPRRPRPHLLAAEGLNAILFFDEADAPLQAVRRERLDDRTRTSRSRPPPEDGGALARSCSRRTSPEHRRGVPAGTRFRGRLPVSGGRVPGGDLAPDAPDAAPLADDIDVVVWRSVQLSGGGIRHASIGGAFLAAEAGTAVTSATCRGCRARVRKLDRLIDAGSSSGPEGRRRREHVAPSHHGGAQPSRPTTHPTGRTQGSRWRRVRSNCTPSCWSTRCSPSWTRRSGG